MLFGSVEQGRGLVTAYFHQATFPRTSAPLRPKLDLDAATSYSRFQFFESCPAQAGRPQKSAPVQPGRIGNQVKILDGSAAVTGDESFMSATARGRAVRRGE